MKNIINRVLALTILLFSFTSCELVGDIFQAGMGVGIFIVIFVMVLIIWLFAKFFRR